MSLYENISKEVQESIKAGDTLKKETLRMLLSALSYAKIEKMSDLTTEEEINVVRKEIKKRKESIEAYEKAGRSDKAESEKLEMAILSSYVPQDLTEQQTIEIIRKAIDTVGNNFPDVMKEVMSIAKGRVDGAHVKDLILENIKPQ